MKSFTLHEDDGEDESMAQTDLLHAFLEPLCNRDTPHDFEGCNSGINITLSVNVGDVMVLRDDNSIRVLKKGEAVEITKVSFPLTYMAMLLVEYDNGAHHVNRIAEAQNNEKAKIDLERFYMPFKYGIDKLTTCENALYKFMMECGIESFETFVAGEQGEQEELIKSRAKSIPDLPIAHKLINDWFNDWQLDEEPQVVS